MTKSEIWFPPGITPKRAGLPTGDKSLPDGTRLLFQGPVKLSGMEDVAAVWWYSRTYLKAVASMDPTPHGALLHVSVSLPDQHPDWETIHAVRDLMFPSDVDVMMVLPREEDYVNEHEHCFHLWQTPRTWGIR